MGRALIQICANVHYSQVYLRRHELFKSSSEALSVLATCCPPVLSESSGHISQRPWQGHAYSVSSRCHLHKRAHAFTVHSAHWEMTHADDPCRCVKCNCHITRPPLYTQAYTVMENVMARKSVENSGNKIACTVTSLCQQTVWPAGPWAHSLAQLHIHF